jgi:hypothetical protein
MTSSSASQQVFVPQRRHTLNFQRKQSWYGMCIHSLEPRRGVVSFKEMGEIELRTGVHGTDLSRGKIIALILALSALSTLGSRTQATDAADGPSTKVQSTSGDTVKTKKAKYEGLPHRQEWELFRQGNSPARDCPGATAMLIEVEGTSFFLECLRIHP